LSQSTNESAEQETTVTSNNVQQFLIFVLRDEAYGVGILHIREIIE
jgi:chemotaxis signal transduction protein